MVNTSGVIDADNVQQTEDEARASLALAPASTPQQQLLDSIFAPASGAAEPSLF
jgi:hypothetical protein